MRQLRVAPGAARGARPQEDQASRVLSGRSEKARRAADGTVEKINQARQHLRQINTMETKEGRSATFRLSPGDRHESFSASGCVSASIYHYLSYHLSQILRYPNPLRINNPKEKKKKAHSHYGLTNTSTRICNIIHPRLLPFFPQRLSAHRQASVVAVRSIARDPAIAIPPNICF